MPHGWLLCSMLLLTTACSPPASPPPAAGAGDSAGRQLLSDWLSAYNAGSRDAIERFRAARGLDIDADQILDWRRLSGRVSLLEVERDAPEAIVALLQPETTDTLERIEFALEPGVPAQIASFTYLDARRPAHHAIPRMDRAAALHAWAARGDELAQQQRFSGVILAVQGDGLPFFQAWGMADRDARVRNGPHTRFRLGSMNKMFTAVAILQLVEAGTLSLDDTLAQHLPDYPNRALASTVTVRQLLSHRGGTGDIFGPEFDVHRLALRSHDDYLALYGRRAALHAPGEKLQYSNYGFVLLGALIEKVSGLSYYDYVQQHVFAPAGMSRSGSLPESAMVESRATAYTRKDAAWVSAADTLPYRGTAAGGGYSTAEDLLRFAQALQRGTLLSPASLQQALTPQGSNAWYGLGFILRGEGATRWYGHDGGAPGMSAVLHIHPVSGWIVIALANIDPPAAERLAEYFENRMPLAE